MGRVRRALEIYGNQGFRSLLHHTMAHLQLQLDRYVLDPIWRAYWDIRGEQSLLIGETIARFDGTQKNGGDVIRSHFRSERPVLEAFVSDLRPDDEVFDVGGHLGLYTCFAANVVDAGAVIAFEPFPPNLVRLLDNVSRNAESNVTIVGVALSDSSALIPIDSPTMTEDYGSPSIGRNKHSLKMASFAGDQLIRANSLPSPTVVKIDVEGAEGLVLDGLSEALSADKCRRLYCELHPPASHRSDVTDFGHTIDEVISKIRDLGFSIEATHERGSDIHVIARRSGKTDAAKPVNR